MEYKRNTIRDSPPTPPPSRRLLLPSPFADRSVVDQASVSKRAGRRGVAFISHPRQHHRGTIQEFKSVCPTPWNRYDGSISDTNNGPFYRTYPCRPLFQITNHSCRFVCVFLISFVTKKILKCRDKEDMTAAFMKSRRWRRNNAKSPPKGKNPNRSCVIVWLSIVTAFAVR